MLGLGTSKRRVLRRDLYKRIQIEKQDLKNGSNTHSRETGRMALKIKLQGLNLSTVDLTLLQDEEKTHGERHS